MTETLKVGNVEMTTNKPGIKTTEFWVTLLQALVGPVVMLLVALGIFKADTEQAQVVDAVNANSTAIVESVAVVVGMISSVLATGKYVTARTKAKEANK